MGFGESVGPWKLLDRFFDVNRRSEARRGRRRAGAQAQPEKAPDLISVAGPAARAKTARADNQEKQG